MARKDRTKNQKTERKGKEVDLYFAYRQYNSTTKRSHVDQTVTCEYTTSAFPSYKHSLQGNAAANGVTHLTTDILLIPRPTELAWKRQKTISIIWTNKERWVLFQASQRVGNLLISWDIVGDNVIILELTVGSQRQSGKKFHEVGMATETDKDKKNENDSAIFNCKKPQKNE